jgi:hypothetical protein
MNTEAEWQEWGFGPDNLALNDRKNSDIPGSIHIPMSSRSTEIRRGGQRFQGTWSKSETARSLVGGLQ